MNQALSNDTGILGFYKNAGMLRTYIFLLALIGKLVLFIVGSPEALSGKLLLLPFSCLIGLILVDKAFSGIIITECIRIIFNRKTISWSNKKHFLIVFTLFASAIVIQMIFGFQKYSIEYYNQGWSLAEKGDYEGAIANLDIAININPKYVTAYLERAWVYKKSGDFKNSIADYNKALDIAPENPEGYQGRGYAYYNMGNFKMALMDWEKAIILDPAIEKKIAPFLEELKKIVETNH